MNGQKDKKRLAAKKEKGYMTEVIQGRNNTIRLNRLTKFPTVRERTESKSHALRGRH